MQDQFSIYYSLVKMKGDLNVIEKFWAFYQEYILDFMLIDFERHTQVYGTFGVKPPEPCFRPPPPKSRKCGPKPHQPLYFWKACGNSRFKFIFSKGSG